MARQIKLFLLVPTYFQPPFCSTHTTKPAISSYNLPILDSSKGRLVSDVKHYNHPIRATIVGCSDGEVLLLTCCVPNLKLEVHTIPESKCTCRQGILKMQSVLYMAMHVQTDCKSPGQGLQQPDRQCQDKMTGSATLKNYVIGIPRHKMSIHVSI